MSKLADFIQAWSEGMLWGRSPEEWLSRFLATVDGPNFKANRLLERLLNGDDLTIKDRRWIEDTLQSLVTMSRLMAEYVKEDGQSHYRLVAKQRRRGNPHGNKGEQANRGRRAASMVERLVGDGWKQEAAIAQAKSDTGASRSEIMEWLKNKRAWREYSAAKPLREAAKAARQMFICGNADRETCLAWSSKKHGLSVAEVDPWLAPASELEDRRASYQGMSAQFDNYPDSEEGARS